MHRLLPCCHGLCDLSACRPAAAAAGRHAEPHPGVGAAVADRQWRAAQCGAARGGASHLLLPVERPLPSQPGSLVRSRAPGGRRSGERRLQLPGGMCGGGVNDPREQPSAHDPACRFFLCRSTHLLLQYSACYSERSRGLRQAGWRQLPLSHIAGQRESSYPRNAVRFTLRSATHGASQRALQSNRRSSKPSHQSDTPPGGPAPGPTGRGLTPRPRPAGHSRPPESAAESPLR